MTRRLRLFSYSSCSFPRAFDFPAFEDAFPAVSFSLPFNFLGEEAVALPGAFPATAGTVDWAAKVTGERSEGRLQKKVEPHSKK